MLQVHGTRRLRWKRRTSCPTPNRIAQMVPKGVLPCLPRIKVLELSHNVMRALPDDVAQLTCAARAAWMHAARMRPHGVPLPWLASKT